MGDVQDYQVDARVAYHEVSQVMAGIVAGLAQDLALERARVIDLKAQNAELLKRLADQAPQLGDTGRDGAPGAAPADWSGPT